MALYHSYSVDKLSLLAVMILARSMAGFFWQAIVPVSGLQKRVFLQSRQHPKIHIDKL